MEKKIQERPESAVLGFYEVVRKKLLFFVSAESDLSVYLGHSINYRLIEALCINLFRHSLRSMSENMLNDIHGDISTIEKQGCSGMASPVTAHGLVDTGILCHHLQILIVLHVTD